MVQVTSIGIQNKNHLKWLQNMQERHQEAVIKVKGCVLPASKVNDIYFHTKSIIRISLSAWVTVLKYICARFFNFYLILFFIFEFL